MGYGKFKIYISEKPDTPQALHAREIRRPKSASSYQPPRLTAFHPMDPLTMSLQGRRSPQVSWRRILGYGESVIKLPPQGHQFHPELGPLDEKKKYYVSFTVNPRRGGEGMPVQKFQVEEKTF